MTPDALRYAPYSLIPTRSKPVTSPGTRLVEELQVIHRKICQIPTSDDLRVLLAQIKSLTPCLRTVAASGGFPEAQSCRDLLTNIKTLASAVLDADRVVQETKRAWSVGLTNGCTTSSRSGAGDCRSVSFPRDSQWTPQHDPYRLWFLNHLSYPYPTPKDCKLLLEQVPPETINQLRTWFTNTRRRSKWSDMYKKYTDCNASKMNKLVEAITSPLSEQAASPLFDGETIEKAKADLEAVKEYFGRSEERKKVSRWINDSIEKTKHLPTAVIRTPESSPTSSAQSSPPSSPTSSPTRKRGRKNAKPSLYAKPNIPVIETYDIPVIAPQQTLIDPMW